MFKLSETGNIVLDPNLLQISEFDEIYKRDKDKNKPQARKELKYIYFMCEFKPPYNSRPVPERMKMLGRDIFSDENYTPDKSMVLAIDKYNELNITAPKFLLQKATEAINILGDRLGDKTSETKDLLAMLKQLKEITLSFQTLKESVDRDEAKSGKSKGSYKKGNREDPD